VAAKEPVMALPAAPVKANPLEDCVPLFNGVKPKTVAAHMAKAPTVLKPAAETS
jgi:hypothetical protein